VIVLGHRVFRLVKLAHAGCADSHIVEVGATAMRAVTGVQRRQQALLPPEPGRR
jgi:hypothetical protein